ncbi:hypothetical protein J2848_007072 [Azospirillum lipoferum]|nr:MULTISPECIES: hypothetical protein [Azospirillum]MCP1615359.1 hypothetical protein [Azospirillum lipoferum]MDW5534112.1 hypothetical protein [Azospirillum sp. NL1]
MTDLAAVRLTRELCCPFHLSQDFPGFTQEGLPGSCQGDAPFVAVDQLNLQFLLQLPQLLAEGWLRDVAPRRGAVEMQLFAERDEKLEPATIHAAEIRSLGRRCKGGIGGPAFHPVSSAFRKQNAGFRCKA